jgi:hypothetical protein
MSDEKHLCKICQKEFKESDMMIAYDEWYCHDCFNESFYICERCNEPVPQDDATFYDRQYWCENCLNENTFVCEGCDNRYYSDDCHWDGDYHYCNECHRPEDESEVENIKIPFSKIKSKGFKVNKYKNLCGAEIECLNADICKKQFDYDDLKKYHFSQVYDGSLDNQTGVEFVSNAFSGDCLLFKLKNFCRELENRNYYVDKSCGLHVHIATSKRLDYVKKVYAFYSVFENMFFRMLPKSRQNNTYCRKFTCIYNNISLDKIKRCKKALEFQKLLYASHSPATIKAYKKNHYNGKRYGWINFHSLFFRGTIEIRSHSGTISYNKIKNWLLMHLRVLHFIKNLPLETICELPQTDSFFLSLFDDELKKYIKQRWSKFEHPYAEEEN